MINIILQIKSLNINQLNNILISEEKTLEWISSIKWNDSYKCRKCEHTNFCKGKSSFSRRCTRCKYEESATANTPFHRCKLPINTAFKMVFDICQLPDVSTYKLSRDNCHRQMTCWKLKKKVIEIINSEDNLSIP